MNATTFKNIQGGVGSIPDEKMDQVREILFGDYQRQADARIDLLEERIRELELSLHRRLDALQARVDALAGEIDTNQRSAFEEIAKGVQEFGDRVRRLARTS